MRNLAALILLTGSLITAGGTRASAQGQPSFAQVVALDECDPTTFNAPTGAGPGFCKKRRAGRVHHAGGSVRQGRGRHSGP
jgi:hypothetical protein